MAQVNFEQAHENLPPAVTAFLELLRAHPDFGCEAHMVQTQISFHGRKLGGLDRKNGLWYLSKLFVSDFGGPDIPERHGFARREKHQSGKPPHVYWARDSGAGSIDALTQVLKEMTGHP